METLSGELFPLEVSAKSQPEGFMKIPDRNLLPFPHLNHAIRIIE